MNQIGDTVTFPGQTIDQFLFLSQETSTANHFPCNVFLNY